MNRLRIGILGSGAICDHALRSWGRVADAKVVALAARSSSRRDSLASSYGLEVADDLRQLLRLKIDAVYIAQPNYLHASSAICCLDAGKHVLLEKPFALNQLEAQKVADVAREVSKKGIRFLLAMSQRFDPEFRLAFQKCSSLGQLQKVEMTLLRRAGIPRQGSWFTQKSLAGGGVLLDLGVHLLDQACYLLNEFEVAQVSAEVKAALGPQGKGFGSWGNSSHTPSSEFSVEDQAQVLVRMKSGIPVHLNLAWAAEIDEDISRRVITCSQGTAHYSVLPPLFQGSENFDLRGIESSGAHLKHTSRAFGELSSGAFAAEFSSENIYEFFAKSIFQELNLLPHLEQALHVQGALDAAYRSAALGAMVSLS